MYSTPKEDIHVRVQKIPVVEALVEQGAPCEGIEEEKRQGSNGRMENLSAEGNHMS